MASSCVFCRIYEGEIVSEVLYSDERAFVIRDANPRAPVHFLVIPTTHLTRTDLGDLSYEALLGHLIMLADNVANDYGLERSGYRVVMNQGPDSGQEVAHLHLHVLGGRKLESIG